MKSLIFMSYYLITLVFVSGCAKFNIFSDSDIIEYFEDFENEIIFERPIEVEGVSYYASGNNGWECYMEKTYKNYECSKTWSWTRTTNSNSGKYGLSGKTSFKELGTLWIFKKFSVTPDSKISVMVYGRTKKEHSGSPTGPRLYVFDGEINKPTAKHQKLLGGDYFEWDDYLWSDWRKLDAIVETNSEWITIALCVNDAWEKFSVNHEFDNLRITKE